MRTNFALEVDQATSNRDIRRGLLFLLGLIRRRRIHQQLVEIALLMLQLGHQRVDIRNHRIDAVAQSPSHFSLLVVLAEIPDFDEILQTILP